VFIFWRPLWEWVDRFRLPLVRTVRAERSHPAALGVVQGKAANGYIVASRRAALSADTPGRIVELNVTEGSVVHEGDVVARLYSKEYEASLRRAQADLEVIEAELHRADASLSQIDAELVQARNLSSAAKSDLESAQAVEQWSASELGRVEQLVEQDVLTRRELDQVRQQHHDNKAKTRAAQARGEAASQAVAVFDPKRWVAVADQEVAAQRVKSATAARDLAQATLDKTEVRAPFDGIVVLKDAEVGEVVSPNSQGGSNARGSVCTMVDFKSLEVQADVSETSLPAVTLGATAKVFLDAYPDRLYEGRVARIWPTANRQKATVEVRIVIDRPDELLRPEMGVRVVFSDQEIEAAAEAEAPVVLLPLSSIVRIEGRDGVFVLERDVVRFQPVKLGAERSGQVSIEEGLQGGEKVVVDPPPSLQDGDRVRIEERS